jgi:hypothetical protein
MKCTRLTITTMTILFFVSAYAANPFLDAPNDKPTPVNFRGTEWSDDIGEEDIPLTAQVVTTRIAQMAWGAIFKIEFTDLKSRADKQREIRRDYFIVTDDRIVLLNEDNDAAAKRFRHSTDRRNSNRTTFYGITSGSFEHQEGERKTAIKLKGDLCIYEASHPSGHFKKVVWRKGGGLVEYASGHGAHADGYRLKSIGKQ